MIYQCEKLLEKEKEMKEIYQMARKRSLLKLMFGVLLVFALLGCQTTKSEQPMVKEAETEKTVEVEKTAPVEKVEVEKPPEASCSSRYFCSKNSRKNRFFNKNGPWSLCK